MDENGAKILDSWFRCQICQDYFTAPVLIKTCNHNFCSECIRRHLGYQKQRISFTSQCPTCERDCCPTDLIPNHILTHMLDAYRQSSLEHCRQQQQQRSPPAQLWGRR
ncbi:hypothetical protein PTSG_04411 [Salpingoeca rosetta]|uniref:RING-type E3 ubiquitin transferase n=1 Tax=Salpingoeca rosetta (strain ATCC 50818 / BSB-021) TaxID=946362 RepID=F2U8H4_SALR5|nr:uncharacterized protein PTSG_04411 [Salpingoeca rosetta]EGD72682.1 hypothetical protein PTSG_04411 [Salpingoeca rosetta]|eukprot:XP_004994505.1 hypothetical protein PTSG_04411 [Salpingoeca rosetta]